MFLNKTKMQLVFLSMIIMIEERSKGFISINLNKNKFSTNKIGCKIFNSRKRCKSRMSSENL